MWLEGGFGAWAKARMAQVHVRHRATRTRRPQVEIGMLRAPLEMKNAVRDERTAGCISFDCPPLERRMLLPRREPALLERRERLPREGLGRGGAFLRGDREPAEPCILGHALLPSPGVRDLPRSVHVLAPP